MLLFRTATVTLFPDDTFDKVFLTENFVAGLPEAVSFAIIN
jgi:hypothetical protein